MSAVWHERRLAGTRCSSLIAVMSVRSVELTAWPAAVMCSFHFAQQPQVGLLKTATLGLPVAADLPLWVLTTATDTPAISATAEATAAAVERIIIMVFRSYPRLRKKATIRRGNSVGA